MNIEAGIESEFYIYEFEMDEFETDNEDCIKSKVT